MVLHHNYDLLFPPLANCPYVSAVLHHHQHSRHHRRVCRPGSDHQSSHKPKVYLHIPPPFPFTITAHQFHHNIIFAHIERKRERETYTHQSFRTFCITLEQFWSNTVHITLWFEPDTHTLTHKYIHIVHFHIWPVKATQANRVSIQSSFICFSFHHQMMDACDCEISMPFVRSMESTHIDLHRHKHTHTHETSC